MNDEQQSQRAYLQNLGVCTALLEVGAAVMKQVEGTDEVANTLNGEKRTLRDYEEQISANCLKTFGV